MRPNLGVTTAGERKDPYCAINKLLTDFTQPAGRHKTHQTSERGQERSCAATSTQFPIRANDQRVAEACWLEISHDIGLAAVTNALNVQPAGFDPDLNKSLERGQYYLFPADPALARVGTTA